MFVLTDSSLMILWDSQNQVTEDFTLRILQVSLGQQSTSTKSKTFTKTNTEQHFTKILEGGKGIEEQSKTHQKPDLFVFHHLMERLD